MELFFKNRDEWRKWLEHNHDHETELWLVYYKKHTGFPTVSYAEAVEEALCFGWIDGKIKSIDENRYMQRYTPRKPKSKWSLVNKKRVFKLIENGKMTEAGLKLVEEGKKSGEWDKAYSSHNKKALQVPNDLNLELKSNTKALSNFMNFTQAQRNQYIKWIERAKRLETRDKRIKIVIERSEQNIKPGI